MTTAVHPLPYASNKEPKLRSSGRNLWALADQILISGTNFLTTVLTVRALDPKIFGQFTLVYSVLLFANSLQSALVTQPHNVLGGTRRGASYVLYTSSTLWGQLALAGILAAITLIVCAIFWGTGSNATELIAALAISIIAWQLQEFVRRVLYTEGRFAAAFANDVVSYGGQTGLIAACWWFGWLTGPLALYTLAATSALGFLLGWWQIRGSLSFNSDRTGIVQNWNFGKWLAGAEVLGWLSSMQVYLFLIAAILGKENAGMLRAVQVIFGPTRIFSFFLATVLPIRFARLLNEEGDRALRADVRRIFTLVGLTMGSFCLLIGVFAQPVLQVIYHDHFANDSAAHVLALYGIYAFFTYMQMVIQAALTAQQRTRPVFLGTVAGMLITLALGWAFVEMFGVPGAVIGMAFACMIVTGLFWFSFRQDTQQSAAHSKSHSDANESEATHVSPERSALLYRLTRSLRDAGLPLCILHGHEKFAQGISKDVDCMVTPDVLRTRLAPALNAMAAATNCQIVQWIDDRSPYVVIASRAGDAIVPFHFSASYEMNERSFYRPEDILDTRMALEHFDVPAPAVEFGCVLINRVCKGSFRTEHYDRLKSLYATDAAGCAVEVRRFFAEPESRAILSAVANNFEGFDSQISELRGRLLAQGAKQSMGSSLRRFVGENVRRLRRWIKPASGLHVVFLGPDGVGKSTVVDAVLKNIGPAFLRTDYHTFAPSILPNKPKPSPHALPPRSYIASLAKAGWWLFYYGFAYFFTVHPSRARCSLVLNHRYFLDAIVDPKRYRYSGPMWLLKLIWKVVPKPDLVILLDAPADIVQKRKQEVTLAETTRQRNEYRALISTMENGRIVDASQAVAKTIADANQTILRFMEQRTREQLGLDECSDIAALYSAGSSTGPRSMAPALTWSHLLPRNAELICDGAPDWFRQMAAARSTKKDGPAGAEDASNDRAIVIWEGTGNFNSVDKASAIVGVNCGRPPLAQLRNDGFEHVRRFAVLPNLRKARWFIPLDRPAISAAAFSLYNPAKFAARMKRLAARIAAYLRVPFWYRQQIWIAQREAPLLEQKIQELFGNQPIRLALSSGAPEPARNRKVSVSILSERGKILGFAKIAGSALSRRLLEHEAAVLSGLTHLDAPRLLFAGEIDGIYLAVQTPLPGRSTKPTFGEAHRVYLDSLRSETIQAASATALVAGLPARVAACGHPVLERVLLDVMPRLQTMRVPSTVVHGDFAPWNLLEHRGQIAAFDWEYGQLGGLPLIDELNYRLQVGFLLEHWTVDQAHEQLTDLAMRHPLRLAPRQVRDLELVYLLDILARLLHEGYDTSNDMVAWYLDLLVQTSALRNEVAVA